MANKKGIKIEDIVIGTGRTAEKPLVARVIYDLTLNKGETIQTRFECLVELGLRRVIAGLRYGIEGMRVGGRRRFRVSPHLAYGEHGAGSVPANAVLIFDVELLELYDEIPPVANN